MWMMVSLVWSQCDFEVPGQWVVYHLLGNDVINVDGILNESAWMDVGWSNAFLDIQGSSFPVPRFQTFVKMRWDDQFLYVGAFLEETQIWANQTQHDSVVFLDNDVEIFIDPDGNCHSYKEMEVNAINTLWDLQLNKPYINGGQANSSWESNMKKAVFVKGKVNDPTASNQYWTVELAIPFQALVENTNSITPKKNSQWRINFSRVEWKVVVVNGRYQKIPNIPEDNWVWTPQTFSNWPGGLNMHLPERWGFAQFATGPVNRTSFIKPIDWNVRITLEHMYYALSKFFIINGYYTAILKELELPGFIIKGECTQSPVISTNRFSFNVTVVSLDKKIIGTVNNDRLLITKS